MICDYCNKYHEDTREVYREEIDDYVELCPDCQECDELNTCSCGNLATHDAHTYCSDCY